VADPPSITTIPEGLAALGVPGPEPGRRPVLRGHAGTLVTLATLGEDGAVTWHGVWMGPGGARGLGPAPPPSLLAESFHVTGPTGQMVDLVQAAARSYVERLEELGSQLDTLEARTDPIPIPELAALQRWLAAARKHVVRLAVVGAELEGPLGLNLPNLERVLPALRTEIGHLEELSAGLAQAVRDLVAIRNAIESNRLAESANELGRTSNRIAALANTSNLRMLGVAYLALVLALVSAVVLIPNTAATILGMPSAGWVPGLWVVAALVALALVPLVVVFSRPWVRRLLRGLGSFEFRTSEGLADLPEVPPQDVNRPGDAERLIRGSP
jgi:hypothetical protein